MNHSLDDARLMVQRATVQFDALNAEMEEFFKANPVPFLIEDEPGTGNKVIKILKPPEFPRRWGVMLGEIVGNCAAALNYLVIALIRKEGREPDRNAAFPISDTKTQYFKRRKGQPSFRDRRLNDVPEPLRKKIDDVQPWQRGGNVWGDALSTLKFFRDAAEHRDLQAAYLTVQFPAHVVQFPATGTLTSIKITVTPEGIPIGFAPEFKFASKTDRIGITIGRKEQPDPDAPLALVPAFGNVQHPRLATVWQIKQVISRTEEVIELFATDF